MRYKWGELISLEYGKPIKDKAKSNGQYPVYGTNGQIGTSDLPPLCNHASFILGRKGAYRGVHYSSVPFSVIDTAFYAENLRPELLNIEWAYYKFLTYDINSMDSGSAIPSTDRYEIYAIEVDLPDYQSQKRIVELLRSLDDKIELNNKINENLERQVQAIYQELFVNHASPEWKQGYLSDLIIVRYGKDHKKLADGSFPVFGSGGLMRKVERPLYDKESVLIPRKGTLNNVMYINEPFWSVDTMFYTEMKLPNVAKFVYHFLKSKDLASMNAGSAVPSMTADILNSLELTIPSSDVLEVFENTVSPMYLIMQHNARESTKLEKLRDSLLPKLMNGEIEVNGI